MPVAKSTNTKKKISTIPYNGEGQGLTFEKVWKMFQESDKRMQRMSAETDKRMKELSKNIGGLNNGLGAIIEAFVQGGLKSYLESKGITQVEVYNNVELKNKAYTGEIDCIAFGMYEGKKYTFLCECKNQMDKDDVTDFIAKIGQIRKGLLASRLYNDLVSNSVVCMILGYGKIDADARQITIAHNRKQNDITRLKVGGNHSIVED